MSESIFTTHSFRRDARWEDRIHDLTPVQNRNGRWYKREDAFAPMGIDAPNGVKVRQLIWLLGRASKRGAKGVLTGGSVHAPQNSRTAMVSRYYGLPCKIVLGGTTLESAARHTNVALAIAYGASFAFAPVGYNPAIQRRISDFLVDPAYTGWVRMPYGVSVPDNAEDEEVAGFHILGAHQTTNLPAGIETIVVPFGSGNSTASLLYGLARTPHPRLHRIHLVGIAPSRLSWLNQRLARIEGATAVPVRSRFQIIGDGTSDLEGWGSDPIVTIEHDDLHGRGVVRYIDRRPATVDGIRFHPLYEGKVMHWMRDNRERFASWWSGDNTTVFWIVGGPVSGPRRSNA